MSHICKRLPGDTSCFKITNEQNTVMALVSNEHNATLIANALDEYEEHHPNLKEDPRQLSFNGI